MIRARPDGTNTHHLHLLGKDSDSKLAELGLILCNGKGEIDPTQLKRRPYPRSAIKTYTGQQKYSDLEPPFEIIAVDDLSGGRGNEKYDEDQSKYMDGWRIDTRKAGRIMMGGQETYMEGDYRDIEQSMPGSVSWEKLTATNDSIEVLFTAGGTFTLDKIWVLLRGIGDFGDNIKVEFKEGSTVKMNKTLTATSVITDKTSVWVEFDLDTVTNANVVATTEYGIVITNEDTGAGDDDCVIVGTDGTDPYYRVIDNFGGTESFKLYFYNNQVYAYSQPYDRSNSALYICGYRGFCDSNVGDLTQIVDASRSGAGDWDSPFASDAVGGIAAIIEGPGSNELQNFRTIASVPDGTHLNMSVDWKIAHTTASQYVVVYTDKWYELESDLGDFVTSHAVADKYVYFAFGEDTKILRYEEYDSGSGVMAHRTTTDAYYAEHIVALRDPTAGTMIFGSRDNHDTHSTHVWRARVPLQDGNLYSLIGSVMAMDSPWDARTTANVVNTVSGGISKIAVAAAHGVGVVAAMDVASVDITQGDKLAILMRSSTTLASGDYQLQYADAVNLGGTVTSLDLPALIADEWTWVTVAITPDASASTDDGAVLSFGINVVTDKGDTDLEFIGSIQMLRDNPYYTQLPSDALITNLWAYAGGQNNTSTNCWAFTENKVFEIQADNGYVAVPLAIDELESLRSINTGRAVTTNDVYLWFSLSVEKTERYFDYSLDDVGVDLGAGLPEDRRGIVRRLLSYPGGVIEIVDGGEDNFSSILYYTGGWHELYRAPMAGVRIEDALIQPIPGSTMQRLVFSQFGDICWIPLALSPENSSDYRFTNESMLQVGKAFSNLQDVEKFFNSIKLITENLSGTSQWIAVDYKTDSDSSWVTLDTTYTTSASQSVDLDSKNEISGIWIEVRLRIHTNDNTVSPYLLGIIIESLTRVPVKFAYDISFRLKDKDITLDKGKGHDSYTAREKLDILDDWVSVPTPIKLYSHSSFENDRWVYVEPSPVSFVSIFEEEGVETRVATLTLVEI